MKKNPKNQGSAPQQEGSITKKSDELGKDELNKVTGGVIFEYGGLVVRYSQQDSSGRIKG